MRKRIEKHQYKAKTKEILYSFIEEKAWCKLLLDKGKDYDSFLRMIVERNDNYFENVKTIKDISLIVGFPANIVTKWIREIYDDLLDLNMDNPSLFKSSGIQHDLIFNSFGGKAYFTVWLPQSPKVGDRFMFHFIKAAVGTPMFWVTEVGHYVNGDEYTVSIWLDGREINSYREWLVDRALFTGVLHFRDVYEMDYHEIDKVLLDWYKK